MKFKPENQVIAVQRTIVRIEIQFSFVKFQLSSKLLISSINL